MKKIIILFVVITFSVTKINAQTEWAPIGAKWMNEEDQNENSIYIYSTFVSYKDTIFLGKQCKRINTFYHTEKRYDNIPPKITETNGHFFMYEENGKVFYTYGDSFLLLYDFSLSKGDTFSVYQKQINLNDTIWLTKYIIDSIDYVQVSGKMLKRQFLHSIDTVLWNYPWRYCYDGTIIEKIGHSRYLFGRYWEMFDNSPPKTKCYEDNLISFKNSNVVNCNGYDAISEIDKQNEFKIYPNPTIDMINISSSIGQKLIMKVYSTVGQCVLQKELNNLINSIDISSLTKGIYILKITSLNGTLEKKLIKE